MADLRGKRKQGKYGDSGCARMTLRVRGKGKYGDSGCARRTLRVKARANTGVLRFAQNDVFWWWVERC